ncbi:MAG: putative phage abortive infection protein [Acinetobacter sp.]
MTKFIDKIKKNNICKINWSYVLFSIFSISLAIGLFSYLIFFYTKNIGSVPPKDPANLGPFGDYIGGLLNPVIAGLALFWLIYSVKIQNTELQKSSAALTETVNTAKKQNEQVSIQNFESLFFQLLKTKTDVTNDILVGSKETLYKFATYRSGYADNKIKEMVSSNHKVLGKESIKYHLILFKSHVSCSWEEFYTASFLDYAGSYFRVSYQIVKLIDQNDALIALPKVNGQDYSRKQKEYFDIFRATFTQYELEAFFLNCLSKYGNGPFKELLEKYGMFEPLLIDTDRYNERVHALTRYAYKYDRSIFEKNDQWESYFKMIDHLSGGDINSLFDDIVFLYEQYLISFEDDISYLANQELSGRKNNLDKVESIIKYIKNQSVHELDKSIHNKLNEQIQYLKDCEKSRVEANKNNQQFLLEKIDSTKERIQRIQKIKNIDGIKFILISRIYPSEFLVFFKNKNS